MSTFKHNLVRIILLILLPLSHAYAMEARTALVIGNSNYSVADRPLNNPLNDADDMTKALEKIGFEVIVEHDLDAPGLDKAVKKFTDLLDAKGGYGFFYYAGHGVSLENENYLIGIDSKMEDATNIKYRESIAVNAILERMVATKSSLNLMVLDACRDNPFEVPSNSRSVSGTRGLAAVEPLQGSMVVFSTALGATANDGDNRNGTFTEHFLKHLVVPGLTLAQIVNNTKIDVRKATNNGQRPWVREDLTQNYVLYPKATVEEPEPFVPIDSEMALWSEAVAKNSTDSYAAYLYFFPEGKYIDQAAKNIALLKNPADEQLVLNSPSAETRLPTNPDDNNPEPVIDSQVAMLDPEAMELVEPPKTEPPPIVEAPESQKKFGELTINSTPETPRIFIMNIREPYRAGMVLEKNRSYDILVKKTGYKNWRQKVFIDEATTTYDVELAEISAAPEAAYEPISKAKTEQKKPVKASTPGLRNIQSGKTSMGCSAGDSLCMKTELPVTEIRISPYQIGASEVTVGEFREFVKLSGYKTDAEKNAGGFTGCLVRIERDGLNRDNSTWTWKDGASWSNPGFTQTDDHPVTCVSWNDAIAYTKWMTKRVSQTVRLPTEAEWEHAARAGSTNQYGTLSSSKNLCDYENGADESKSPFNAGWAKKMKCNDGHWNTAPVNSYNPNAFGVYDMLGNVHEWTQDVWQSKITRQASSGKPNLKGDVNERVIRGGAWDKAPSRLRVSVRNPSNRDKRASMIGFRIVRELVIQSAK